MVTEDTPRFEEFWNGLRESYGKPPLSSMMLSMDFMALSRYSLDDVIKAGAAHRADREEGMYCPQPAHLIRHLELGVQTEARSAWLLARRAVSEVGRYGSVRFPDPRAHYALEAVGGWNVLCDVDEDERPHLERRFIGHFADADARNVTWGHPDVPDAFLGESAVQNRQRGFLADAVTEYALDGTRLKALTSSSREVCLVA